MMPLSLARLQPIRLSVRVFIRSLSKLSSDGFVSAPTSYDTQDDPKFDDDADRALGEAWDLQRSPSGKYRNLLQWIGQPQVLDAAVQRLKSRQLLRRTSGMGTSIDRDWMRKAPGEIRSGLYKFTRPVISTVPTPMAEAKGGAAEEEVVGVHYGDLAVQEAMYIALEKIYEEYFVDELHSFRVGRGAHSAVRQLKYLWKGCKYFVHTEIDSLYSSMDMDVLERLLHEFIEDKKFVEYVCTAFGLSLPGRNPKRNVLAPILSNVYLRELDMVVKEMQDEYNCDKLRRRHLLNGLQDAHDPNYVRINYIRYADDFIVGFSGPDEILEDILLRIRGCLSRTLNLRYTEPKVELAHTKVVSFLGFLIGFDHPRTMAQDAHNEDKRIRKAREQVKERWLNLQSAIVRYGADWLTTGLKKERLKWASYAAAKVGFCRALKTELRDLPHEFIQKFRHGPEYRKQITDRILEEIAVNHMPGEVSESIRNLKHALIRNATPKREHPKLKRLPEPERPAEPEGQYYTPSIRIMAPLQEIFEKLRSESITYHFSDQPSASDLVEYLDDESMIRWYRAVGRQLLEYYAVADNLEKVQKIVHYTLRRSAQKTIAIKHRTTPMTVSSRLGPNLTLRDRDGSVITSFLSYNEVMGVDTRFNPLMVHPDQAFFALTNRSSFLMKVDAEILAKQTEEEQRDS